ncbi:hypothetical protein ACP70R_014725 [Stipagrostis hirtigluma subsp. patula]
MSNHGNATKFKCPATRALPTHSYNLRPRHFVHRAVIPSEQEQLSARQISALHINKVEELWKISEKNKLRLRGPGTMGIGTAVSLRREERVPAPRRTGTRAGTGAAKRSGQLATPSSLWKTNHDASLEDLEKTGVDDEPQPVVLK